MEVQFSVVIPLYNKQREIGRTIRSVLQQTRLPDEIIVVDDGSTDASAQVVREIDSPLIRLIEQPNGGVSNARNRGMAEARGSHLCLLDGDDYWEPTYLQEVERLITQYPDCGMYCTGFYVVRNEGRFPNETSQEEGIVRNYFQTALRVGITQTSSVTIPRTVFERVGGFPPGMKLGEDQYMWTKIAREYPVCYTPLKLSSFNLLAENRSAQRYRIEETPHSFRELYDPRNADLNEYIARCEIGKAIVHSTHGYTAEARRAERFFSYTRRYRLGWWKLWSLNRLPVSWRAPLLHLYKRLTWLVSRKGVFET